MPTELSSKKSIFMGRPRIGLSGWLWLRIAWLHKKGLAFISDGFLIDESSPRSRVVKGSLSVIRPLYHPFHM